MGKGRICGGGATASAVPASKMAYGPLQLARKVKRVLTEGSDRRRRTAQRVGVELGGDGVAELVDR